ncbi:hypothetical protein MSAN_02506100 [Mycena sanguinolenta]|uniref:Uncharacterized protein n=1 Tax=Mycena sanguinolenta TaxID=230812 RepID=A0A8H6U0G0_9AGAR|nr:hypothetical protein MSAN_02506100 [Mycena sanguinolenta]
MDEPGSGCKSNDALFRLSRAHSLYRAVLFSLPSPSLRSLEHTPADADGRERVQIERRTLRTFPRPLCLTCS